MSVTPLATRKGPADLPGRQSLREAIARAAEAKSQVAAIKDALERAERLAWAGRAKLEAATKAVSAAKAEDAEQLAAALVSGGSVPAAATRRAREEQAEAADALEAARSAVARLEADLKDAERAAERAAKDVSVAIAAALAPVARQLAEEARRFRAEYLKRQHAIDAMAMNSNAFTHLDFSVGEEEHRQLCAAVRQPWLDAIEALKQDADAPLPL
jgi:hypothetical protein